MGRKEESGVGVGVEEWGGGWTPEAEQRKAVPLRPWGLCGEQVQISSLWTRWKDETFHRAK